MARLRVALCQLDAVVGDLDANLAMIEAALAEVEAANADLAVFPELMLTGYPPEDLLCESTFLARQREAFDELASRTRRCAAVVGFVDTDGGPYNAAGVLAEGKLHGVWHKEHLPNYGVFDERRWFVPGGGDGPLFLIGGARVAVVICEDVWDPTGPVRRQASGGAELIVTINASPFRAGVLAERQAMLAARARDARCPLLYVNLVGGQDELVFDGASMAVDAHGTLLAVAAQFASEIAVFDLELVAAPQSDDLARVEEHAALPVITVSGPRPPDSAGPERAPVIAAPLDRVGAVYAALVLATRDYVAKNGFSEVVIGLSGGIDSTLVATIATDALGPGAVHGVAMPSRFSSPGSTADASALATNLGIDYREISIEAAHAAFLERLAPSFSDQPPGLAEENLQARVRGTLLMALSNKLGWIVLTTGNKSETAVGFSTLYGDTAGGFAVIRDVPKTLVYELCRHRNAAGAEPVIPESVLTKAPSAELRADQRDEDSLPPYDVLDPIVEGYVERGLGRDDLVAAGFDATIVERVLDLVDRAEYKRRQAPPGPRVTSRAFGKDRRMPITNGFRAV